MLTSTGSPVLASSRPGFLYSPISSFFSAWTVIAALAHNLGRWTSLIGLPDDRTRTAATRRRRLFRIPGRLTRSARQWTLRMPARWPWQQDFDDALTRIRALPALA